MLKTFFKDFKITPAEAGLAALVGLYVIAGYIVAIIFHATDFYNPVMYVDTSAQFTWVFFCSYVIFWGLWALYSMVFIRPPKLRVYLWADLQKNALNKERLMRALPVFVTCIFLLSTFTSLKTMIPYVNGFKWDTVFSAWDANIHGGIDPWRLLQPIIGHPYVTMAINLVYNMWLAVLYVVLFVQLLSLKDPHTRMQFFYTLTLCWALIGSLLAMLFSSGGPCYYAAITGLDHYKPLMDYLYSIGSNGESWALLSGPNNTLWALTSQEYLWNEYITKAHNGIGAGISAMPSVHVSTAFLFMLVGWRSNKFWKIVSAAFFAFIMIGSVHLAWHYAIDGYVAIILTWILWRLSGCFLRKIES